MLDVCGILEQMCVLNRIEFLRETLGKLMSREGRLWTV